MVVSSSHRSDVASRHSSPPHRAHSPLFAIRFFADYRRKCEAVEVAYKAKRQKELGLLECRELEFRMIDPSSLPSEKAAYIQKKQA
ncbi:hypothetical protein Tco_0361192 [Tanacetum coccineum]